MTCRIPFIEACFFDPQETAYKLEERFERHLLKLRRRRLDPQAATADSEDDDEDRKPDPVFRLVKPGGNDEFGIRRRVTRLLERRKAASGLQHLKREDLERLSVLKNGARLVAVTEDMADQIAATLQEEMAWMGAANELVWHGMRRCAQEGREGLQLPPILLDGPPGIGKSRWARRLGELLMAPTTVIEATTESASFGLVGSQRGWGSACPGRLIETVLQSVIANPVMVLDEIDKAGMPTSTKGNTFSLVQSLLPLLEPMTARRWSCPYFQVKFDMSWVIWVLTSNNHRALTAPLLSRCPPIRLRDLTLVELEGFVRREGVSRRLSEAGIEAIVEALKHPELRHYRPSVRVASRMLQRAEDLERRPRLH